MKKILASVLCCLCLSGCGIPKDALQLSPESLQDRQTQTRRFETTDKVTMLTAATAVLQDLGFNLEETEIPLGILVGSKNRDATSGGQIAGAIILAALTGVAMPLDSHQTIRVSMVMREKRTEETEKRVLPSLSSKEMLALEQSVERSIGAGLKRHYPAEVSRKVASQAAGDMAKLLQADLKRLLSIHAVKGESIVRVTFQRIIFDTHGRVTRAEQIKDPELYQKFYEKLSQAVFLEAHEI
ncbi:MAG: hypothetical protein IJE96_06220 [Mailhella sp.]|nr:hypothetical protein [Mailhella sp.]